MPATGALSIPYPNCRGNSTTRGLEWQRLVPG